MANRRKFSREYKLEAVRRVTDGGEIAAEVARALGIEPGLLYGWVRLFKSEAKEAFRGNGRLTAQDEELRALRRQLADVTAERDFLKKAATWFAKQSR